MLAAYVARFSPDSPLDGLEVGQVPDAEAPSDRQGWEVVDVRAAALNQHDLWSLRGVGLKEDQLPMVLGCDAAGVTADGREVIVHAVVGALPTKGTPEGTEPRSILSERYPGTLAEQVAVPSTNLVDKPAWLTWQEAACLPTAWLTAHRAIFRTGGAEHGDVLLVQGAGGGVATAAIVLGVAAGLDVHVTSRSAERRERAQQMGATAHEPGARLPVRADVVLESVGKATWQHSVASVRAGGAIVVVGATTGDPSPASITRIFFHELRVLGSTMG
ncbi:MAG: zinc-binding dehydrogenase, partial [Actinomycetales bacterium]|nr:zinc-binding dehydrogenase [Actinomycetales bacterium]